MALVTDIDGPNILDESNSCKNEVEEDLEDGEIFDEEDDTEVVESSEQITQPKVFKEKYVGEGAKGKDFDSQWEMEQRSQSHQKMLRVPSSKTFAGFNSRPRGVDRFPRNKGSMIKRDVSYLMDDDRPRRKRRKFDQVDEKDTGLRNQHGMFNRRKSSDTSVEPVDDVNDEDMPYVRGNSPDIPNFDQFPREFENEGEDFRTSRENNFISRRGRGGRRGGCDMDRRGRGMMTKRRMGIGSMMKNKRSEDEEKICQYFLQGKCLKENNCTYSHQQPNGRKMELCKFYLMDCCSKEDRCTFMHSEFPCKYYHTGMECYSGPNCRFSHAKLDEEQKKILLKSFGKLRYVPLEYKNENQDFKNNFEEDSKPKTENNFISKTDKNRIPSLLEMQIPVPPELKSTDKNSDEDVEEANNNNSSTPMPSPSRDEPVVDDTFEINENEKIPSHRSAHKAKKHHDKNKDKERQRQEKEMRKKLREERHEEKRLEKSRQRKEDLSINTNDHPLLDDLSDDDEFNDLVIDEEKFQNDGKDQQLPKKQKELLKRIQVQQKFYNETDINEDPYQQEQYSSDVSEHSVSNPTNNALNSSQNDEKEQPPTSSSQPNSTKVEKVDLGQITISDDMAKLLNSLRANSIKVDQPSPFHLPPMEQPYNFEETVQEKKSITEESPASPVRSNSNALELGKSDVDLRQLPFQFPVAAATEIDASLDSHPPMKYKLYPTQVSVTDYSKIPPTMGIDDPRLKHSITAAIDPLLVQNVPSISNAPVVRPSAPQKSAPRDPRKPQQDVNTSASAIRIPLLPSSNPLIQQQRPMDSDMRHMAPPMMCSQMNPQMMAVPNDPRRIPMVPGDPRKKQRFDVDQRINNLNFY